MSGQRDKKQAATTGKEQQIQQQPTLLPLPNYTLSTVCPACEHNTFKLACKVRCPRCGFVWDCSEL